MRYLDISYFRWNHYCDFLKNLRSLLNKFKFGSEVCHKKQTICYIHEITNDFWYNKINLRVDRSCETRKYLNILINVVDNEMLISSVLEYSANSWWTQSSPTTSDIERAEQAQSGVDIPMSD